MMREGRLIHSWIGKINFQRLCQNFMEVPPNDGFIKRYLDPCNFAINFWVHPPRINSSNLKISENDGLVQMTFPCSTGPIFSGSSRFHLPGFFFSIREKNPGPKWRKLAMFPHGRMPGIPAEGLAARVPKTNRHSTLQESTRAPKGSRDRIPYSNHPFSGAMLC